MFKKKKKGGGEREGEAGLCSVSLHRAQPLPAPANSRLLLKISFSFYERSLSPKQLGRAEAVEGYFCFFSFFTTAHKSTFNRLDLATGRILSLV